MVRPFVPAICNCILDMGVFLGFPHRISRTPLVQRRGAALARLIAKARAGLHLNNYHAEPGDVVFRHAVRGDRQQAARLALRLRALPQLAEVREPGSTGR